MNITDLIKQYSGSSDQTKAIEWLQASTGQAKQAQFAKLWRNGLDGGPIDFCNVFKCFTGLPQQVTALSWLQANSQPATWAEFVRLWQNAAQPPLLSLSVLYGITSSAPRDRLLPFVAPLNQGFERFQVNTPLRVCHFLAQVLHESGEFQYQEELASGADYEGRSDLGNCYPGDGCRYKGRGLIQVTGRSNYAQISRDLGFDYVKNPDQLAQLPDCVNSAFWFWNSRGLNADADRDNLEVITLRINGGYNGYGDRLNYLQRAKAALMP